MGVLFVGVVFHMCENLMWYGDVMGLMGYVAIYVFVFVVLCVLVHVVCEG